MDERLIEARTEFRLAFEKLISAGLKDEIITECVMKIHSIITDKINEGK